MELELELIIFLTHNFNNEFLNTLTKIDNDININHYKIIVLFDKANNYDTNLDNKFKNIEIIKMDKIDTSYDNLGHTLYINYFKTNYESINNYKYIWIIENDVYYPNSFIEFINTHKTYNNDLLVSEYGLRAPTWSWTDSLFGFKNTYKIGVLAVIMRFSQTLLLHLIDNIDKTYFGYLEAILPHICIENNLSIQQFLPEKCGILTTNNNLPLLQLIKMDIQNNTRHFIENKIYHPIKL
jgi:hypothetical protein